MTDIIYGTDISYWDDRNDTERSVDFVTMKKRGAKYVYCKATQCNWTDSDFHTYWKLAKEAGLLRGAYHFLTWTGATPEAQADYFWSVMKDDPGELPLVVDFEWWSVIPSNAFDYLYRFLERLKFYTNGRGIRLCIYTAKGFWDQYGSKADYWKQFLLWLAWYNTSYPDIPLPFTKENLFLHQYTGSGNGPEWGAESAGIDLDIFYGSLEDLLKVCSVDATIPTDDSSSTPTGDTSSMFENNAFGIYLDDTYKVTDWDQLANSADVFLVRAAKVPGGAVNYDQELASGVYMQEDSMYKTAFNELKTKRGKRIMGVCEFNCMYDSETSFNRSDQATAFKTIFKAAGNFVPDAVVVKIESLSYTQNSQSGKLMTDSNFNKAIKLMFGQLYSDLHVSILGWTLPSLAHNTAVGYNFQNALANFLDTANAGSPSYSFGFSYIPPYWKLQGLNGKTYSNPRDLLKEIQPLSSAEVTSDLVVGSRSGWLQQAGNGSLLHSFWGFCLGMFTPILTSTSGTPKQFEPVVFDTTKEELWKYMLWTDSTTPTDPGTDDNSNPGTPSTDLEQRVNDMETLLIELRDAFVTVSKTMSDIASKL